MYEISIHAPQWGATGSFLFFDWLDVISIHAPQWGATAPWMVRVSSRVFQSTHPSGVRLGVGLPLAGVASISIHAPQWGATRPVGHLSRVREDFNPRTPVGCDFSSPPRLTPFMIFQSTHPSGVRHHQQRDYRDNRQFQSTHPSGVRLETGDSRIQTHLISIHAPQWGATKASTRPHWPTSNFNPRTPVGCDAKA